MKISVDYVARITTTLDVDDNFAILEDSNIPNWKELAEKLDLTIREKLNVTDIKCMDVYNKDNNNEMLFHYWDGQSSTSMLY